MVIPSVGGAVSAAELYNGVACLAEPVETLNGEIMYACNYALTGEKTRWGAEDITKWRESHESSLDGFARTHVQYHSLLPPRPPRKELYGRATDRPTDRPTMHACVHVCVCVCV